MKKFPFSKYHGRGNDFLIFDDREQTFPVKDSPWIASLCHRQLGVGADGLILLQNSSKADVNMRIFNADGSEASSCGNGLCCLLQYLKNLGFSKKEFLIETGHSIGRGRFSKQKSILFLPLPKILERGNLSIDEKSFSFFLVDSGVPHVVIFVEELSTFDVVRFGRKIRFSPEFSPYGANVNFAKVQEKAIEVRTYERGVENETLSCGTGALAVAVVARETFFLTKPLTLRFRYGEVFVQIEESQIRLEATAEKVFSGQVVYPE